MLFIVIALLLVVTLYLYGTKNFDHWKKKGVKHDKPIPFVGNFANIIFLQKNMAQFLWDFYVKYPNDKVVGIYRSSNPDIMIRDPEIIKRILITDFGHFHIRQIFANDATDSQSEPLLDSLVNLNGDKWRLLRQRLTPAFTSGKLKAMFPLIVERAERLDTLIHAKAGAPIDARDLMARFTTDFIGACGFGLDMDSLTDEDSEFRKLGKNILNFKSIDFIKMFLKQLSPRLFKSVRFTGRFEDDVLELVNSVLTKRNYTPTGRNDFVDILLECRQKGTIVGESMNKHNPDGTPEKVTMEMTDDLIAAQMLVFFVAGFETSSSTSSMTLHQLAFNPKKQIKVQEEIDRVLAKYDNKLCYEAVKDMHYLEWAFKESMRKYPAIGFLFRDCARKYVIPELNLTIDKGTRVYIPVMAMQNDPQYFKEPEEFRPERFSPEELDSGKVKFAYLPFGDGPRSCIGERLGQMQAMAGLAAVLSKFTVEPHSTTLRHPIYKPTPGLVQLMKNETPLMFRERKKKQ